MQKTKDLYLKKQKNIWRMTIFNYICKTDLNSKKT